MATEGDGLVSWYIKEKGGKGELGGKPTQKQASRHSALLPFCLSLSPPSPSSTELSSTLLNR